MTEVQFDKARWQMDSEGDWLCIRCGRAQAQKVVEAAARKKQVAAIKEYREKRSKSANDYAWALLDELADAIHSTKNEIYIQKVREIGPFKDFILTEDEARTFRIAWERLGIGWPTEQVDYDRDGERLVIRAYYGSSTYNTKQMSRLIESIVQDCKDAGIDVLSERERSLLIDAWKPTDRFNR